MKPVSKKKYNDGTLTTEALAPAIISEISNIVAILRFQQIHTTERKVTPVTTIPD